MGNTEFICLLALLSTYSKLFIQASRKQIKTISLCEIRKTEETAWFGQGRGRSHQAEQSWAEPLTFCTEACFPLGWLQHGWKIWAPSSALPLKLLQFSLKRFFQDVSSLHELCINICDCNLYLNCIYSVAKFCNCNCHFLSLSDKGCITQTLNWNTDDGFWIRRIYRKKSEVFSFDTSPTIQYVCISFGLFMPDIKAEMSF